MVIKGKTGENTDESEFIKPFYIRQIFWGDVLNLGRGTLRITREFCIGVFRGLVNGDKLQPFLTTRRCTT